MESTDEHGEHVDELGHDRESGTARADRVDEIAAESRPRGQGAGGGPFGAGMAGDGEGLGGGTPTSPEATIGGGTGGVTAWSGAVRLRL